MRRVLLKFHPTEPGQFIVTLPEYDLRQCWSQHDSHYRAMIEAQEVAHDMGYDGVEDQTTSAYRDAVR